MSFQLRWAKTLKLEELTNLLLKKSHQAMLNHKLNKEDGWIWRTKCPFNTEYRLWVRSLMSTLKLPDCLNDRLLLIHDLMVILLFLAFLFSIIISGGFFLQCCLRITSWITQVKISKIKTIIHRRFCFRFNIYSICMVYLLLNNMSKTTLKWQQKYWLSNQWKRHN